MRVRTLRSLMILTVIVAAALSTQKAIANHQAKTRRYQAFMKQYGFLKPDYDVGRVLPEDLHQASKGLLDAQCAVSWGRKARIAAIAGHVNRVSTLYEAEQRCSWGESQWFYIKMTKGFHDEARARLAAEMSK